MSTPQETALLRFINNDLLMRGTEAPVGPEDDLLFSGLLDSIAVMRLVGFIETDLSVAVPPEDVTLDNFASVTAITTYLDGRAAA